MGLFREGTGCLLVLPLKLAAAPLHSPQNPVSLEKFDEWIACKEPGVKADLTSALCAWGDCAAGDRRAGLPGVKRFCAQARPRLPRSSTAPVCAPAPPRLSLRRRQAD